MTHPITQKLLDHEICLKDITKDLFYSNRIIYPTYRKAVHKNFEAEHIKTVAIQIEDFNLANNTCFRDRREFQKSTNALDDRCFRMTPFEHIISHYLKAREDDRELRIFGFMVQNMFKLSDYEKLTLENCIEFSELRENGFKKAGEAKKGRTSYKKGKHYDEIYGEDYINPLKGRNLKEYFGEDYVNPKKGKTMKEIRGEAWVNPLKGKKRTEILGEDWKDSRTGKTFREIFGYDKESESKGRICYTNGERDIFLRPDDIIPEGYVKGTKTKGKTAQERYGEDWVNPSKGKPREKSKNTWSRISEEYHRLKDSGEFNGTWYEFLKWRKSR